MAEPKTKSKPPIGYQTESKRRKKIESKRKGG